VGQGSGCGRGVGRGVIPCVVNGRSRPFVWGSSAYRELWDKAVAVG